MSIENIHKDFPILSQTMHGKRLAYLDSAATSQKPKQVIQALTEYYEGYNANVHRSIYQLSEKATAAYEGTRQKVAEFINAYHHSEIIFTKNATEGFNITASILGSLLNEGDEILLTQSEHHSNIVPWQMLASSKKVTLTFLPIDDEGKYKTDHETLSKSITKRTKIISFAHISNVLGYLNDAKEVVKTFRKYNPDAYIVVDGAQAVPHVKVDVKSIDADFYVFTGHKMLGPTGIGVVWGKRNLLENLPPFLGGSDMILEVDWEHFTPNLLPFKYEAGTPNVAGVIGLGAAIDYLKDVGMETISQNEFKLLSLAYQELSKINGITLYGPKDPINRSGLISFSLDKIHAHDLASVLDTEGVAIRSGHHCAQPLVNKVIGLPAVARASFYLYNNEEDVQQLIQGIKKAQNIFSL